MTPILQRSTTTQLRKVPTNAAGRMRACAGFTLIEMLGVLAILAILAAALLSVTSRSLNFAASNLESTNLVNFASALQNSVLRNRYIPGPTGTSNWVQMIAAELGVNPYMVSTNARNVRRVLLADPNNISLPYSQTSTGTGSTVPPIARLMIVSSLGPPFPAGLVDGTTSDFSTIWNTPDGTLPIVSSSNPLYSWSGKGEDLKVQRLNFSSSFVHLVLWNYPTTPPSGRYQIDYLLGPAPINVVAATGVNTFLLKSSILSLLDDQSPAVRQVDQILSRDSAFFYIESVWRGTLDLGQGLGQGSTNITEASKVGSSFAAAAAAFTGSPYSSTAAAGGTTPPSVLNSMSNFMTAYNTYADDHFPSGPIYNAAKAAQDNMFTAMSNLVNGLPNPGGCIPAP